MYLALGVPYLIGSCIILLILFYGLLLGIKKIKDTFHEGVLVKQITFKEKLSLVALYILIIFIINVNFGERQVDLNRSSFNNSFDTKVVDKVEYVLPNAESVKEQFKLDIKSRGESK